MVLPVVLCGEMPTSKIIMKVLNTKLYISTIAVITSSTLAFQCDQESWQIKNSSLLCICQWSFVNQDDPISEDAERGI